MAGRAPLGCLVVAAAATCASTASAAVRREGIDREDLGRIMVRSPQAAVLLEQGEVIAAAGRLEEADALFRQGLSEAPGASLLLRRHCEALTAMGRRNEAVETCYRALEGLRSNGNVRATVRALAGGPAAPTMGEVGMALDLAANSLDRAPGQFTPIAAMCDIATSIGDGVMLQNCGRELQRISPEAPETKRAMALLSTRWPRRRLLLGWGAIVLASLATLAHALWRQVRRSFRRRGPSAALVGGALLATLTMFSGAASAQKPGVLTKWPINDEDPESTIPPEADREKDPFEFGYWMQDVILKAEIASKEGKHESSVKFYRALARSVPERAISYTKMCEEYEAMGDLAQATNSCGAALFKEGVMVKDYEHYVHLVLATPGPLTNTQIAALGKVLAHMREDKNAADVADNLACEVGVRTSNTTPSSSARPACRFRHPRTRRPSRTSGRSRCSRTTWPRPRGWCTRQKSPA